MENKSKNRISLGVKLYVFIGLAITIVGFSIALVTYHINASQIDNYFKRLTLSSARTYATTVDVDIIADIRDMALYEEYQKLRQEAEDTDNEALVIDYIKSKGLWDEYVSERQKLQDFLSNMDDIKYLYIAYIGGSEAVRDMYVLDDVTIDVYETGYYEDREIELYGMDGKSESEPSISNGDWGWLCSSFVPMFDENGEYVASVGCDVAMDDIIAKRRQNLLNISLATVGLTFIVMVVAILLIKKMVVKPLVKLKDEMKNFSPSNTGTYEECGVLDVNIKSNDEIRDIYDATRSMQTRIIDYLKELVIIKNDYEKAEDEIRIKDKLIGQVTRDAYRDVLTSVGNKAAYNKKAAELSLMIGSPNFAFAIVMADVNRLKYVNDHYGHKEGDIYIKGCCSIICNIFKHSPVFRVGGDEFVVILTGEDFADREAKMATMRESFDKTFKDESLSPWFRYSVATGIAELREGDKSVDEVLDRADSAMYEEKEEFKNKYGDLR